MYSKQRDFISCISIHLRKNPREALSIEDPEEISRKGSCENFSSFYSDPKQESRCLLDEYLDEKGTPYFSIEKAMEICPNFRLEGATKCCTQGQLPRTLDKDSIAVLKKYQDLHKKQTE